MKKTGSELIAKLAKIGAGTAVAAAVVVGFSAANRSPRESAVVLSSIPESSVSYEYKSPANSVIIESNSASENSQIPEMRNTDESKPYLVNINTATSRQLQELSGIGEAKAAAIIEYRETHDGFSDISELLNVSGIGEAIYEKIRDYVTVGDVPPKETPPPETSKPSSTTPAQIPVVNINTASLEELQKLPGIGSAKAAAIVQYRSVFGEFTNINEIKNVSGIGESIFEGIRDYITVGNVSTPVENTSQPPEYSEIVYINLNTATLGELCKLPGIGTVKAQAIIEYREANGNFYSIEEIKNVNGIGDKIFENIREYIYVDYRGRSDNNHNSENSEINNPTQSEPVVNYPVNLNTATFEELCTLPGIDKEKAQGIIQFRIDHGGFNDIRELQHVNIDIFTIQSLRYIVTV